MALHLNPRSKPAGGEGNSFPNEHWICCLFGYLFFFVFLCAEQKDNRSNFDASIVPFILQAAWNGSVSHNWANRITRYRDTITEDSPTLINGAFNMLINDNGTVNKISTIASSNVSILYIYYIQMQIYITSSFSISITKQNPVPLIVTVATTENDNGGRLNFFFCVSSDSQL